LVRTDRLVQADEGLVQADAGSKRNANIGMAHKAARNAGCGANIVNFGREHGRSSPDIVLICSAASPPADHRGINAQ
jgi:hypothetical protein